ncbi:MAG: glutamyl-tRNA reductase, partial [Pseudomonadota bacterium]
MHLLAFGVNHQTAPVEIREQVAFVPEKLMDALGELTSHGAVHEAAILSTCNRTELYCNLESANDGRLVEWFCDYHRLNRDALHPYL